MDLFSEVPGLAQMNGIVVLCKPSGPTSAQCLTVLKRQGQRKIGHAGTLDPMASGVLPVLLGQATKLSPYLLHSGRKIYSGRIRLGVTTDSWDMDGNIVAEGTFEHIGPRQLAEAVAGWLDLTEQEVPAYSAAKFQGQPLYKLARKGQHTPRKVKPIRVFEADILDVSMPYVGFRVSCASGTYIRSLAHSLGQRLGCGAALCQLTRECSHPFTLEQSVSLEELRQGLRPEHVLSMTTAAPHWPCVSLSDEEYARVRNGVALPVERAPDGHAFLCHGDEPVAVARVVCDDGRQRYVIERGLWNC